MKHKISYQEGSVRKKGNNYYYRFRMEESDGTMKMHEFAGTRSKRETEAMLKKAIEEAEADQFNIMKLGKAVYFNLLWLEVLMGLAIMLMIVGFLLNFAQNSGGIVKTIVAGVIVIVGVGAAYFIATNHGWVDGVVLYVTNAVGQPMLDAAGEPIPFGLGNDPETRTVFGANDYQIADISIWITYLAFIGAALAAVFSSVRGIFKS